MSGLDEAYATSFPTTTAAAATDPGDLGMSRAYIAGMLALLFVTNTISVLTDIVRPAHAAVWTFLRAPLAYPFFAGCLLASAVVVWGQRSRSDRICMLVGAGLSSSLWLLWRGAAFTVEVGAIFTASLGGAALVALGWRLARGSRSGRDSAHLEHALVVAASFPLFALVSNFFLQLTAALLPRTYDVPLFHFDESLGWNAAFWLGRVLDRFPLVKVLVHLNYLLVPVAAAALFVALAGKREARVLARVLLLASIVAYLCYFVHPAVGPRYLFGPAYPGSAVSAADVTLSLRVVAPYPRNCMPSLHMAWALLLVLNARPAGRRLRIALLAALGLTAIGTLGLGEHYLVDLVVAVPFAVAVQAVGTTGDLRARVRIAGLAGAVFVAWVAYLSVGYGAFPRLGLVHWGGMLATLAMSSVLYRRLRAVPDIATERSIEPLAWRALATGPPWVIGAAFFISGFAALLYEVVFSRALALTFGSMAIATNTVLATYMGGIALGSWLGGRMAERTRDPLRLYAGCEAGIAAACVVLPLCFPRLRDFYALVAAGTAADSGLLTTYRVLLGAAVLAPPTVLMGMTMPAMVAYVARHETLGRSVAMLYAANTVGAGIGALLTGYVILPAVGMRITTWTAVGLNVIAALLALRLRGAPAGSAAAPSHATAVETAAGAECVAVRPRRVSTALTVLGVGGFVTLALEVDLIHLLAVVAGNSAYAFSLMLFAFLVGLGGGASAGRWLLRTGRDPLRAVALAEVLLACSILASTFLWAALPDYFASFANYPMTRTFAAREFVRAGVCVLAMLPSAFFIGAVYPLAIEVIGRAHPARRVAWLGGAAAVNTAGNILGALVGGFVLLPLLGAISANQALAIVCLGLGAVALLTADRRSIAFAAVAFLPPVVLLLLQPRALDYTRIASGANVYFSRQEYGHVIDHAESLDGGLTTVAESRDADGRRVLTLLTNGKFQGDTGQRREMNAQAGFALAPLLHTAKRDRALIIGLGTGMSARVLHDAGFRQLDVVELSGDVQRIAERYFREVNGDVTRRPGVVTHVTDGRNFLLTQAQTYDVISMEISSIWFAGSGALYNREFYQLARRRLSRQGVLQQWVQLHRISWLDIVAILATVRSEFPYVWLYCIGNQGIIVAATHEALPSADTIDAIDRAPRLTDVLDAFGGSVRSLLADRLLTPADTEKLLAFAHGDDFVSNDDNMFLEYSTPRGNVRDYAQSLGENIDALKQIGSPDPLAWTGFQAGARPRGAQGAAIP